MTTTRGQHLLGKEIGSCILERLLGYGGSSAVFLARSLTSEEQVAVKVFLPRSTLDGQMRKSFYQRFLREAEAASQLDHPNILSVFAYGEHESMPYIVMPYMEGGTLSEYIQQHGPLSLEETVQYLEQIATALDFAHEHNCVHCDVKPANILLDSAGNAALSDFGIVRMLQETDEADGSDKIPKQHANETLMGTPDYVSPEQALGEKLDGRSDVYSLGATVYSLLTGEPPFKADTPIALALMHVHEAPTPVGLLRADVTPQIDFVLLKALAKWPEERFQTAGEFATAFKLAINPTDERALLSPKQVRLAKRRLSDNGSVTSTPSNTPAIAQSIVPIKQLTYRRSHPWRTGLLIGLVVLLVLACLSTALLIRTINSPHARNTANHPTPTSSPGPFDLLAGDKGNWPQSTAFFFLSGTYSVVNTLTLGDPALVFYKDHYYGDFHVQVTTREMNGSLDAGDYYGIAFRAPLDQSRYYFFEVTAAGGGQYDFLRYDGGTTWKSLGYGLLKNFNPLKGASNTLSVDAKGTSFTLAVNGKPAGKVITDDPKKAF
ncbi:MAG TPA: serine/threonine-protein kinase, partial [Ktedonobacteraceae bacterium]